MASEYKKMIESAMPGWTLGDVAARPTDAASPEPDQTGVDFEQLKRAYLPKRRGSFAPDAAIDPDEANPSLGSVRFETLWPKTRTDTSIGSKTIVVDPTRGIIGKQG